MKTINNRNLEYVIGKCLIVLPPLILLIYIFSKKRDWMYLIFAVVYVIVLSADEIFSLKFRLLQNIDNLNKKKKPFGNIKKGSQYDTINKLQEMVNLQKEEMETLRCVSSLITSTFEVEVIIENIFKAFNKYTDCDRSMISFYDNEKGQLICKYEYGDVTLDEVGQILKDDSTAKTCYETRKTIISSNVYIKARKTQGDKLAIPLNDSGRPVGVIFMEAGKPGIFKQVNQGLLESLASYAMIAIKNAELFNSIYLQKQEIEALYEETTAVNEELNNYIEDMNKTKEELKNKNEELLNYYNEIKRGYLQTMMALANSIEANDPYTAGHCQRVMEISCEIAKRMGFSNDKIESLRYAAIVHDIGKIAVRPEILNKGSKLTENEYDEVKKHPIIAYNILKDVNFLKDSLSAIVQHHERYDGTGYPRKLKGNQISVFAKILCISDAFDAMTTDRPYRKGMSVDKAIEEIEDGKDKQFDPVIADIFISFLQEVMMVDSKSKVSKVKEAGKKDKEEETKGKENEKVQEAKKDNKKGEESLSKKNKKSIDKEMDKGKERKK